jgi:DNA-binding beta-propeller fold protein YncE
MTGIKKLHDLDQRVTLLNDPKALSQEWTEDAVRLTMADPGALAIERSSLAKIADLPTSGGASGASVVASKPKNQIVATVTSVGYADSSDLAVSPDGAYVYVANDEINSRGFADPPRVISTATNTVVAAITDKSTTNVGI